MKLEEIIQAIENDDKLEESLFYWIMSKYVVMTNICVKGEVYIRPDREKAILRNCFLPFDSETLEGYIPFYIPTLHREEKTYGFTPGAINVELGKE